jgi:hypothetical protein
MTIRLRNKRLSLKIKNYRKKKVIFEHSQPLPEPYSMKQVFLRNNFNFSKWPIKEAFIQVKEEFLLLYNKPAK